MGEAIKAGGSSRLAKTLPTQIVAALAAQTLTIPATAEFGRVIAGVAAQLRDARAERAELALELEARLEAHPLAEVRGHLPAPNAGGTSMPGVGLPPHRGVGGAPGPP